MDQELLGDDIRFLTMPNPLLTFSTVSARHNSATTIFPWWSQVETYLSTSFDQELPFAHRSRRTASWFSKTKLIERKEEIGKVLSSIASSATTSCSSWTESYTQIFQNEEETMVFKKAINRGGRSKTAAHVDDKRGVVSNAHRKKNQLVQAVSPFDELPVIQDLFEQLSPKPKLLTPSEQREAPHQRPLKDQAKKGATLEPQQRDPPELDTVDIEHHRYSFSDNGAHDVPTVIEIPTIPTKSEDSDLTLASIWRGTDNADDDRGPRTLTPHPSFEEVEPSAVDLQYLLQAALEADKELWPSDEDSIIPTARIQKKKEAAFWSNGSMHVWDLDGGYQRGGKKDLTPNRRVLLAKRGSIKSKTMAMF
jgi:hypothetical protein